METVKLWDVLTRRSRVVKLREYMTVMTCGHCGRSWDDARVTSMTPVPSARCPFEGMRRYKVTA